ncbi:Fe-S cluster assembly protein SufD [Fulvivirgaceae bacterium BMA10]|uniref:Fe-S cluster assembly protein SufD n=1 Tax=Splendidivirga corallicola TaxID=3051826 RepID=A0ABT8KL27_9BACT|nr:Fe-S cluster assembly protein SufD [Fulvivirgaceae bacterium BMA10]
MSNAIKADLKQNILNNFKSFEAELNGQSRSEVHQLRRKALDSFESVGFPGVKNEEYKYTPITKSLGKEFDFNNISKSGTIESKKVNDFLIKDLDAYNIVIINGQFSKEYSNVSSVDPKLSIQSLAEAFAEQQALLSTHFAKYANSESDTFTALNTAFSKEGVFINVDSNYIVDKPIAIYFISDADREKVIAQPRNLILVGKNSEVEIIESFYTIGAETSFTNVVSEIVVGENAHVHYAKIGLENDKAHHIGNTQVYQAANSVFNATTATLEGGMVRNNMNIVLDAEGCEANMYGLYLLNGKQHVDNHTMVDHRKPNSFSNELYKGIMNEKSTGVFNGKIFVRQDAQKTNAFQSNKNILLSDDATINTKPQLEIWADDVKCSHGATTGQLDEEQLFYLRARGLSKESARAMLLYAFAHEAIEKVKSDAVRDYLDKLIKERLNKNFQ